jgi:hypothetical protein
MTVINSLVLHYTKNSDLASSSKKRKIDVVEGKVEGNPIFTMSAMSITQPVRKKLDVVVYENVVVIADVIFERREISNVFALATPDKVTDHTTIVMVIGTAYLVFGFEHKSTDKTSLFAGLSKALGMEIVEPNRKDFVSSNGKRMYAEAHLGSKQG